jgi:hypothetical protein
MVSYLGVSQEDDIVVDLNTILDLSHWKTLFPSDLSFVLNLCPNSVGVNAVQKPAVFASVSDRRDVDTRATNGTTQINTIKAKTKLLSVLVIIT